MENGERMCTRSGAPMSYGYAGSNRTMRQEYR